MNYFVEGLHAHRQELEIRICREVFPDRYTILNSKEYRDGDLTGKGN